MRASILVAALTLGWAVAATAQDEVVTLTGRLMESRLEVGAPGTVWNADASDTWQLHPRETARYAPLLGTWVKVTGTVVRPMAKKNATVGPSFLVEITAEPLDPDLVADQREWATWVDAMEKRLGPIQSMVRREINMRKVEVEGEVLHYATIERLVLFEQGEVDRWQVLAVFRAKGSRLVHATTSAERVAAEVARRARGAGDPRSVTSGKSHVQFAPAQPRKPAPGNGVAGALEGR